MNNYPTVPYHTETITIESWIEHNPGTPNHLKSMTLGYLQGKGIPTEQEWKDGKPVHPVVFNVEKPPKGLPRTEVSASEHHPPVVESSADMQVHTVG